MPRAIVFGAPNEPLRVEELQLGPTGVNQIRVRLRAAGVCHSDLHVVNSSGVNLPLPMVLGHEGAGEVIEVGEGVTDVAIGDHVVLATLVQCGVCDNCLRDFPTLCRRFAPTFAGALPDGSLPLSRDGAPVRQMAGIGCWSEEIVVDRRSAVTIDKSMPLTSAALLGCAVVTGFGAVSNVAKLSAGETIAVIGCGGVGLNAIQAAAILGASKIVAVDVSDAKLEVAREFGATHVVNSGEGDAVAAVRELTEGGTHYALDFVGTTTTAQDALSMTLPGGTAVLTGLAHSELSFSVTELIRSGRTIKGNFMGMGEFTTEYGRLVELYQAGRLKLDELVSSELPLDQVQDAFDAMRSGTATRSVLVFD